MASRKIRTARVPDSSIFPILISFAAVLLLMFGLRWLDGGVAAWATLPGLIGASTLLTGVMGLVRFASASAGGDLATASGHVAVVLAGGILVGGGWGAALGLALLASTAQFLAHRRGGGAGDGA